MNLRYFYIILSLTIVSCEENNDLKISSNNSLISIVANKDLKILCSKDLQNLSIIKEDSSKLVILKFEQNKLRQIDSIYFEKKTGAYVTYLLKEDLTIQLYKKVGHPKDDIIYTLERFNNNDYSSYQKKISKSKQDFNQSFHFKNDSLVMSSSLFFNIYDDNKNGKKVKFHIPITEDEKGNYNIQADIYDIDLDSSNYNVIKDRIYISDTYLIKSYGNVDPNHIVIPYDNQKTIRITMFESSSEEAYSTFLFDLSKKDENYNRALYDYEEAKRITKDISFKDIKESINKDLEQFNGFKYENKTIIIDSLMKDKIMNH